MTPTAYGRSKVRLALAISSLALLAEYLRLLGSPSLFWAVEVLLSSLALAVGIPVLWALSFPAIQLAALLVHALVGCGVSRRTWQARTALALWPLPYAATFGVSVWLVYSLGRFGGWPDDVVFGTLGNAIGAWCFGTILIAWGRLLWLRRRMAEPTPAAGHGPLCRSQRTSR
jgi:hypothetical protein